MTNSKEKFLKYALYIYYIGCFWKNSNNAKTLINSSSKVYTITTIYTLKLNL